LQPIWSQPLDKPISFDHAHAKSKTRLEKIASDLHLTLPSEV
jgi:hypothetical protein